MGRYAHKREKQAEGDDNDDDDEDMPPQAKTKPSSSGMPSSLIRHISTDARLDAMRKTLEKMDSNLIYSMMQLRRNMTPSIMPWLHNLRMLIRIFSSCSNTKNP
ncbi:Uncharacterized protein TCM_003053 [Theobroma cacao]|uniref:Uncharacterized protein n=1 Tax=Theobroma cacao TaxID=3641 RepID=A0A061DMS4_THECC|nr:Uncharacterized protein TCM_003053 [Theobroma cacao]